MVIKPLISEKDEEIHSYTSVYNIYTDGGYHRDGDIGGWSYVIVKNKEVLFEDTGIEYETTNNIMELYGAIEGMKRFVKELGKEKNVLVNIICDSSYVLGGIKLGWIEKWKRNNWIRFGTNKPVKHKELWLQIDELNSLIGNTKWIWVRGHSGNTFNEMVDENIQREIKLRKKNEK